jgi:hypothetical protein
LGKISAGIHPTLYPLTPALFVRFLVSLTGKIPTARKHPRQIFKMVSPFINTWLGSITFFDRRKHPAFLNVPKHTKKGRKKKERKEFYLRLKRFLFLFFSIMLKYHTYSLFLDLTRKKYLK